MGRDEPDAIAGDPAWRVLRWSLLGTDGAVTRGWHDKRALDRSPRVTRSLKSA